MTFLQGIELVLVGVGALAHLHIVLSRSASAKTLWFNPALYAWTLSWAVWYALIFSSLNLETLSYGRFPGISMAGDLLKGALLNLQCAFLLQGLSRWTGSGSRIPGWLWYVVPASLIVAGAWSVVGHPMVDFLMNVEPVARAFLVFDLASCLLGIWMLGRGLERMDRSQRSVARPFLKALVAMVPFLVVAIWIKLRFGMSGPARYNWVLLHDVAHLLPPLALLWAAYRTESVALEVTRSSLRRARTFAAIFVCYILVKVAFPLSEADRAATWAMAGLGLVGTMGPLIVPVRRILSEKAGWGLPSEIAELSRLEARLWREGLPADRVVRLAARGIGRVLDCRWKILPEDDPRIAQVFSCRGRIDAPIAMFQATSRSEIPAWEALGARTLLRVRHPSGAVVIALGASSKADRLPDPVLERLESLTSTLGRVLESRQRLRQRLEDQRRLQEGERLAMLGLMAASTAHEIKNPLSAIRNVATAALREAPADSTLRQDLTVVVGEVDRLDATVRRMLHFARDRDTCDDAGESLRVVAGLLAVEGRARKVELRVRTGEGKIALPMSENDLKAILFNLVQNAIRHAPPDSQVELVLDDRGPSLEVSNRGSVSEEIQAALFQPLVSREGTGLGLYISRAKAQAAGGELVYRAESDRTVFRLAWDRKADALVQPREGEDG